MADYLTVGVHQINKWLWLNLKSFEYKTGQKAFTAYKDSGNASGINLIPIIPTQQQPEFVDISGGAPFIVYNYIMSSYPSEWWICREQCAYVIYDNDEERLRAIHAYMADLLKRVDWTAKNINNSSSTSSKFDFKYVQLTNASGPDEFNTEGGRQGAMVVIDYEYTTDINGNEGNGMRV
jgi:hypothetical protein